MNPLKGRQVGDQTQTISSASDFSIGMLPDEIHGIGLVPTVETQDWSIGGVSDSTDRQKSCILSWIIGSHRDRQR